MKNRNVFIGFYITLIPLIQPLFIKTIVVLSTTLLMLSLPKKVYSQNANYYFNSAIEKRDKGDYSGAISDLTKVIKINPKDGEAYLFRSDLKKKLKDYSGAISDQNKGLIIYSKDKVKLSAKDIIEPDILNEVTDLKKNYMRITKFNNKTYQRPIKYYIHDQSGKKNFEILPSQYKYAYEISQDEEKFISDTLSKLDSLIDLDFERVYSPKKATIRIFKTNPTECCLGKTKTNVWKTKLITEIGWSESEFLNPKLNDYPTLSSDDAATLLHEIGHALGLSHDKELGLIDPDQYNINNTNTSMSYNNILYPEEDKFFTNLDISALQKIWGVEKDKTTGLMLPVPENVFEKNAEYYFESANKKAEKGDHYGAISDYTKVIELDPKDADAYYNRAMSKDELKDYYGAISDNTKVIELDPKDAEAYLNRSLSKESLGDIKGACVDANIVVSLGLNDPENKNWIKENC